MLAMVVNDDAGCLDARGDWACIASMLAPTGGDGSGADQRSRATRKPSQSPRASP